MAPVHILLVEDNEGDILLTREAFDEAKLLIKLSVVRNGKEAMDFLTKQGNYPDAQCPDLILLDINLPKINGHELLQLIKGNDKIKQIPVIMLTTSSSEKDIDLSYYYHVNCYITKPIEVNDFFKVITTIENFWISIVKLPTNKINNQ